MRSKRKLLVFCGRRKRNEWYVNHRKSRCPDMKSGQAFGSAEKTNLVSCCMEFNNTITNPACFQQLFWRYDKKSLPFLLKGAWRGFDMGATTEFT